MTSLESKIESFIRTGKGDFNALACELFHHQCQLNPAYGNFAATIHPDAARIDRWEEIPALPIAAFKQAAVASFPVAEARTVFRSSGTTSADRSAHYFKNTDLYELSIVQGWPSHPTDRVYMLALSPGPDAAPDSSLVHMFNSLISHLGHTESAFIQDHRLLADLLERAQRDSRPVWLLGTALALHGFLDFCDKILACFRFESDLLVMETGGFKGRVESVPSKHFYRRLCSTLGISMFSVLSEYGMCELSSQFYTRPGAAERAFHAPAWVRARVVHPMTGDPLPEGEMGALEIFDLANVHSALAIRTEDVARATGAGFVLEGRIPAAPLKGCSLTV